MHLLHQNIFEIDCASKQTGMEVQERLSVLLEREFYPKLDLLFDQYQVENHLWKIENLTIQLPIIKAKNWEQEFCKSTLEQVEDYLKNHQPKIINKEYSESTQILPEEKQAEKLFYQFLKTGFISGNTISDKLEEILSRIALKPEFIRDLVTLFEEDSNTIMRYFFNTTEAFKMKVKLSIEEKTIPQKWFAFFKNETSFKNISDLETWISSLSIEDFVLETDGNLIKSQLAEILRAKNLKLKSKTSLEKDSSNVLPNLDRKTNLVNAKEEPHESVLKRINFKNLNPLLKNITEKSGENILAPKIRTYLNENIYVKNAGLIILHPFLKPLFEQTNLSEKDLWISKESQQKAILLTQYLITGKTEIFENELVLNKVICGLPIENVVNTKLKISNLEIEKCLSLLEAVLDHWKSLKGSSVETVRETFLQRNGKLLLKNNKQELWVEEKGVDILMDQLPWGIGTIKTPWMTELLMCNWR